MVLNNMIDDRRLRPRYDLAVPIDVDGVRGTTRNVSMNGVIFNSPVQMEIGREIRYVVFLRAGNCHLHCRGRVIRQRATFGGGYDTGASIDSFAMLFEEPT